MTTETGVGSLQGVWLPSKKSCPAAGGPDGRFLERISNWEIHPVHAIDLCVFKTLTKCAVDDESVWTPLHEEDPE